MSDDPKCDECEELAMSMSQELKEIEPVEIGGELWADWETTGKRSFGCNAHPAKRFTVILR